MGLDVFDELPQHLLVHTADDEVVDELVVLDIYVEH